MACCRLLVTRLLALLALAFPVASLAVEVVEGQPAVVTDEATGNEQPAPWQPAEADPRVYSTNDAATAAPNSAAELFLQVQSLQDEVRQLRGLVEEQQHLIEQLQQRRMDDYLEFDRRIVALGRGGVDAGDTGAVDALPDAPPAAVAAPAPPQAASAPPSATPPPAASAEPAEQARLAYRAAYQKVKDREFDDAKVSLLAFVSDYPDSRYVPNAQFWLGELYYLDSDLEKSQQAFAVLVHRYPDHRKVADAKFKLGKVYHQLGDTQQARAMLESVINEHPGSTAANPAREYLKNSIR